jgi:MtN3 and saliva related transmembrane protein
MTGLEILGFTAAILTTLCWLPQAMKTIRTRDTRALSLIAQSSLTTGIVLWLVYGWLIENGPLIFANCVSLVLVGTILVMKLRFG